LVAIVVVLGRIKPGIQHLGNIACKNAANGYLHRLVRTNTNFKVGYVYINIYVDNAPVVVRIQHKVAIVYTRGLGVGV
jgi:hypothetical protein